MKNMLFLLALGITLMASKCNEKNAMDLSAMPDLKDTRWVLSSLAGEAVNLPQGAEAFLMLDPEAKSLTGSGGCNNLFGNLELAGEALSFSNIGSTKKYCDGIMDTEKGFMEAIRGTKKFSFADDGMLNLLGEKGKVLAALSKVAP